MPGNPYMDDFLRNIQTRYNGGFQPYAAGEKRYGASGRDAPNIGPTSSPEGYAQRDRIAAVRRNVMLKKLRALRAGNYNDPAALNNQVPGQFRM